jgi:type VI secretion system protein ImpK
MPDISSREPDQERGGSAKENRPAQDGLAMLYQGFLVVVLKVQSRREKIPDAVGFRRKMKAALQDVERSAGALGYDSQDTQDAHLAVVAFLDEVILGSDDPTRTEWMRFPLAQDLLGQPAIGEVFFERLEGLLRTAKDSSRLAEVLEVFLLCMALGFEGKYSGERKAELHNLMERARARIESIRQHRGKSLSPGAQLPEEPLRPVTPQKTRSTLTVATVIAGILVLVLFVTFKLHLVWAGNQVQQLLGNN